MMPTKIRRIIIGVGLGLICIFGILNCFFSFLGPVNAAFRGSGEFIEIKPGIGVRGVANMLREQGMIKSTVAFETWSLLTGSAHRLQSGVYFLDPSLSSFEIIAMLSNGVVGREVTIPEGATLKDIDAIVSDAGILKSGEFAKADWSFLKKEYDFLKNRTSIEGYVFPDTYRFLKDSDAKTVLEKFLANFVQKISARFPDGSYDTLILASIVEKEVFDSVDRPIVAGILDKRLKVGQGLHVDAPLIYMKCAGKFLTCTDREITVQDKAWRSPYNTYLYAGLPPTPIGNPGLGAIVAAENPHESSFWYYLSDPKTGKTVFSKTLDEHNANRLKYLQ